MSSWSGLIATSWNKNLWLGLICCDITHHTASEKLRYKLIREYKWKRQITYYYKTSFISADFYSSLGWKPGGTLRTSCLWRRTNLMSLFDWTKLSRSQRSLCTFCSVQYSIKVCFMEFYWLKRRSLSEDSSFKSLQAFTGTLCFCPLYSTIDFINTIKVSKAS